MKRTLPGTFSHQSIQPMSHWIGVFDMSRRSHRFGAECCLGNAYEYLDLVPTVGLGINADTLAVETTYDGAGNPFLLGQLVTEYQEVNGAVNTSASPKVQYAYSFTNTGSMNHSRPTTLTYPNGRVLTHNYNSGINFSSLPRKTPLEPDVIPQAINGSSGFRVGHFGSFGSMQVRIFSRK
jgi:hypothetical protein